MSQVSSYFPSHVIDPSRRQKPVLLGDYAGEGKPLYDSEGNKLPIGRYDVYAGTPESSTKVEASVIPGDVEFEDLAYYANVKDKPLETRFTTITKLENPRMYEVLRDIEKETKALAKDFYSGNISAEEVKARYKELAAKNFQANYDNRYIIGDNLEENKKMAEVFYSSFRFDGINEAVNANNIERQAHVQGNPVSASYYNSDYYYKSEDFVNAITEAADELSKECNMGSFEIPDYSSVSKANYRNFNSAWEMRSGVASVDLIDLSSPPPEGFKFYHQQGQRATPEEQIAYMENIKNGGFKFEITQSSGDSNVKPQIPSTPASFWASVKVGDETITKTAKFNMMLNSYYKAADYMSFSEEETGGFEAVNKFLGNLSIRDTKSPLLQRNIFEARF